MVAEGRALTTGVRSRLLARGTDGGTIRRSVLPGGLRVITESMPGVHSATFGVWVGVGSRDETPRLGGASHFLEHLLFKGTRRRSALQIAAEIDAVGGELNAFTGKESTCFYAHVIDRDLPLAVDVVCDVLTNAVIAAGDVDNERGVILEEIAMRDDDPGDAVHDLFSEVLFGDHPLGRPVIGRADVIADTSAAGLRDFHARRYAPQDVVIAAAGSLDHDAIVELADGLDVPGQARPSRPPPVPEELPPHLRFLKKETEQYHITLGAPALARDDERRFILRVLDNILGGTSSSRLFQEVRELRGLAYNVYSFQSLNAGTGLIGVYLGTRPDNVAPALKVVADELERLREDGVTPEELERSKENVKGRIVLSLESTASRMSRLGSAVLSDLPLLSLDEVVERIESVTIDELDGLLRELLAPERLSAAAVGVDEDVFRAAIEPLAPELLARAAAR